MFQPLQNKHSSLYPQRYSEKKQQKTPKKHPLQLQLMTAKKKNLSF